MLIGFACTPCLAQPSAVLEYNTVNGLGPHELAVGQPTQMRISLRDVSGKVWGIGAVIFDFEAPNGGLTWDLNGPDDVDFTEDDGFVWQSGLDGLDDEYFATVDPPQSVFSGLHGSDAVQVPANGLVRLATIEIIANDKGDFLFVAGVPDGMIFTTWLPSVPIVDGTHQVTLTVVPEPDTLAMLGLAVLLPVALRRRGRARTWATTLALVMVALVGFSATETAAEALFEYDTGNHYGPHYYDSFVPFVLEISVRNTTSETWGIGGVIFDFDASDSAIQFDLNGPDNIDFTQDDGFVWQNGLDDGDYLATVDPPQSVFAGFSGALEVPPGESVLLATLDMVIKELGIQYLFVAGDPSAGIIFDAATFAPKVIKDGSEQVFLQETPPEPTSLTLLAAGMLVARRRRRRSATRRPQSACMDCER